MSWFMELWVGWVLCAIMLISGASALVLGIIIHVRGDDNDSRITRLESEILSLKEKR